MIECGLALDCDSEQVHIDAGTWPRGAGSGARRGDRRAGEDWQLLDLRTEQKLQFFGEDSG